MNHRWILAALPLLLLGCPDKPAPSAASASASPAASQASAASAAASGKPAASAKAAANTSASASADGETPDGVARLVVGKSLGPVALGMPRDALEKLGLPIKDEGSLGLRVGPYRVLLDQGLVVLVEVALKEVKGAEINGQRFAPDERDTAKLAKAVGECGDKEIRIGGNIYQCHGGRVIVAEAGPTAIVELKLFDEGYLKRTSSK